MDQTWFEMSDIRRSSLATSVWIPLRASHTIERIGKYGYPGFKENFLGAGSLAVPLASQADAMNLSWDSIGIRHNHSGVIEDGKYVPADVYEDYRGKIKGIHLVLDQRSADGAPGIWHLHQDLLTTLSLRREGAVWVRPEEDYLEVARLVASPSGGNARLEIRASHLGDYLNARGMGLVVASYRQRTEVVEHAGNISWPEGNVEEKTEHERWTGRVTEIHEGGEIFGATWAVLHVARTDVNPEDDVPILPHPTEGKFKSRSWTGQREGTKLYRVDGELWRTEWIGPSQSSPIIRGDKFPSVTFFAIDAAGTRVSSDDLVDSGRWLWFSPSVMPALLERRGASLKWYTRDTGGAVSADGHSVHFGLNSIGLVTVYAKDVALLPEWQRRIWAAHNTNPDGKVSEELQAAQVDAEPAHTQAPESFLELGLSRLQELSKAKLGIGALREHTSVKDLLPRIHRFRANDRAGLFALAKDLARVTADDLDVKALQSVVAPPKDEKWGSLKSLEGVLASRVGAEKARQVVGPLVGVYELRLADAHLPTGDIEQAMRLAHVDDGASPILQGFQLLRAAVGALYAICEIVELEW